MYAISVEFWLTPSDAVLGRYLIAESMPDRERKRIGRFVVTDHRNFDPEWVVCANCGKRLASVNEEGIEPSAEALINANAIAWPNFGWFCSPDCEKAYAAEFGVWCSQRETRR
jgi:hypothetical protein